jgi:hypothetical protein
MVARKWGSRWLLPSAAICARRLIITVVCRWRNGIGSGVDFREQDSCFTPKFRTVGSYTVHCDMMAFQPWMPLEELNSSIRTKVSELLPNERSPVTPNLPEGEIRQNGFPDRVSGTGTNQAGCPSRASFSNAAVLAPNEVIQCLVVRR